MGHGAYYAVGYGVLLDKQLEAFEATDDGIERVDDAGKGLHIRTSNESRTPYWAIIIHDGRNEMFPTQKLKKLAEVKVPENVKKDWKEFCKRLGLKLKPELLWISDYD